jgi:hypothetical protein
MFSAIVRSRRRLNSWKTVDTPARWAWTGWLKETCSPPTTIVPLSGV